MVNTTTDKALLVIEKDGNTPTGKASANALIAQIKAVGGIELSSERKNKTEYLRNLPQGGVLSPTLFLIFLNDIQKQISKRVYPSLYADDLALLFTEEELSTAKARLQTTLNNKSK
ncbi:hypothetical protein RRG08_006286 [Elysia crispata]|uniref:Reverse transcriptase domain-containing protein n=1 Tax=Elysia crispata TaxID=231223 RepID=A0AAE0YQ32_9GAST|nr:hypothetical protein RRG08_006286 [Elysia crispata]